MYLLGQRMTDWHLGWNIRELAHGRQALAFRVKGTSRHVFSHFLPPLPHRFFIVAIKVLVAASLCRIVGSESMMPTGILFINWLRSGLQWQVDVVVTLLAWIDLFMLTEALRGSSYCMQKNVQILTRLNYNHFLPVHSSSSLPVLFFENCTLWGTTGVVK